MMTARIAPVSLPLSNEVAQRMARLIPAGLPPPQLYRIVARNARLWSFLVDSGLLGPAGLLDLQGLPRRLREIVLLRTCVANGCDYEFNLHVQTISQRMGLSRSEVEDLRSRKPDLTSWSRGERALMDLVDALVQRREVSEIEFRQACLDHSEEMLIEISLLVGLYTGVAMLVALARPGFDLYRSAQPIRATLT